MKNIEEFQKLLSVARGEHPADLLITGAKVIDVYSGLIKERPIAVFNGKIAGFEDCEARETINLKGMYISPGFIESHIHIESSKLTPGNFSEAVIPRGTTTVIADPHEIANVSGIAGINFMLNDSGNSRLDFYFMLPSCVPATNMETSGAVLSAQALEPLLNEDRILGLAEMMNYPGAFLGDESVLAKLALFSGNRPIDGHAPGLSGKNLSAYIISGPSTDHECIGIEEAKEKLAKGMRVMIREGSTAKNMEALMPLITPVNERRMMFVSDDRRAGDLLNQGHIDHILGKAVKAGIDPIMAIRMVTLNPAESYGLNDRGGIKPGATADLTAFEDLQEFKVIFVWKNGELVAKNGRTLTEAVVSSGYTDHIPLPVPVMNTNEFAVPDRGSPVRVIKLIPEQIVTEQFSFELQSEAGNLKCDRENDVVKLTVVERYSGTGGKSTGFVSGTGIFGGAIASTVAHDSHNIIAAGDDDGSIAAAVNHLAKIGGGQTVVSHGKVIADLPLPIAGLMTNEDAAKVSVSEEKLISNSREIGCKLPDPFMSLSFLALPVIPALKLTDRGLVDVDRFEIVSLYT